MKTNQVTPLVAGEAANLRIKALRLLADHGIPATGGFVVMYRGRFCGWAADLTRREENGRLPYVPDCLAVSVVGRVEVYATSGGSDTCGAQDWVKREEG